MSYLVSRKSGFLLLVIPITLVLFLLTACPPSISPSIPPDDSGNREDDSGNREYIYAAGGLEGLFIFDVSDPVNPQLIGHYDTAGRAWGVAVAGDYAYVADGSNGLVIIDISDPENPKMVSDMIWMYFYEVCGN
ncbi:LVIVD repeat-containing protein [Kosmotoga pacifica]|uniref:LVIVD repeat protein n=1 Tax=Kosmotoga pacifica TaxID=1330330 RepID=A0A0G2Z8S8_9BACT|nr:hypothetical protein [Kosmotoga pacifica]AKI98000.1 hypothetical protein IX53_09375 [Kosmotoga pacifica]